MFYQTLGNFLTYYPLAYHKNIRLIYIFKGLNQDKED